MGTVSFVPTKSSYIFSYTHKGHFSVSLVTNSHISSTPLYGQFFFCALSITEHHTNKKLTETESGHSI